MADQAKLSEGIRRGLSSLCIGEYAPPSGPRKYYDLFFFPFYRFMTERIVDEDFFEKGLPQILSVFEKSVDESRAYLDNMRSLCLYEAAGEKIDVESLCGLEFLSAVRSMTRVQGFNKAHPKIYKCMKALNEVYRDRLVPPETYIGKTLKEVLQILKN